MDKNYFSRVLCEQKEEINKLDNELGQKVNLKEELQGKLRYILKIEEEKQEIISAK